MSDYGARHACLLRAYEPSLRREVQLGKIVPVKTREGGVWMYVNNLNARLEVADSFGVARPVVALMKEWAVLRVLYLWGGVPCTISLCNLEKHTPWTPGRKPPYYQVPRKLWEVCNGYVVSVPRTDDVLTLRWDEADAAYVQPVAQQLAML